MTALDAVQGGAWSRWGATMGRPTAILAVSAHFERAPVTLGATTEVPLVYDFSGFPRPLYQVRYPAPPAPALADRVQALLGASRSPGGVAVRRDPARGHDHGTWVPLRWLYPQADVPVLSLSLPSQEPRRLVAMGRALRPLRDEGVLVLGSGNVTHNLGQLARSPGAATPAWAREFDEWCAAALLRRDLDAFLDWTAKAPAARWAHPSAEHFTPLLVVLGAGVDDAAPPAFPVTGFEAGSISRRAIQFG
jgi:4,5-DOPA dioxygenase extradiol